MPTDEARHTLYAYVDGSDLHDVERYIASRLEAFIETRRWVYLKPWLVNQVQDVSSGSATDLPDWELGINARLPNPGSEPEGWFADVEAIAQFLGTLHAESGRSFVIGIADPIAGFTEDLFTVDATAPDLIELRNAIGVRPPG